MSFTSYAYLALLAVAVPLYFTVFRRWQWQFLLAVSVCFYAFSGWQNLAYIAATIISTYAATSRMALYPQKQQRRVALTLCLAFNIGLLILFKYSTLKFPLGLSFYTLQTMGYAIDCYRSKQTGEYEQNPFKLALFTSFFPQLVQGPVSRFGELRQSLFENGKRFSGAGFDSGLVRIMLGYFKKLIVADRLLPILGTVTAEYTPIASALVYTVALYCDFTGGIDITIGTAKMFGVKLAENFDSPFMSRNIAEYWRRWHITMGAWFRDYVFYPLSLWKPMLSLNKPCRRIFGDRIGKRVPVWLVTLITWFLTGIWHGAAWNFILWGILNGAVILVSQEMSPLYKTWHKKLPMLTSSRAYTAFQIVRTFLLMSALRALDLFTLGNGAGKIMRPDVLLVCVATAVLVLSERRIRNATKHAYLLAAALAFAVIIFGAYGSGYNAGDFIYTQF